mmetsp:Transcript_60692/g.149221  ORF Transcript_60692/g.149221 Transcript_60692/m.149221 type:complete len:232 (-) Transcript_60692:59-754(-)|eukprot:CAMPEP_0206226966 /NCGR_PEP_ID=MMETSP0047_2-20121206/8373_1 /ASSEMBLY_ACC=CAM_ASM_000192 /TAXON_ID=195065 /ORGANISM="Chroomonas mesostigmatica_cf, Strain CCMP1168" /LENGTH=231 /DNA_ID=CAMNT_0053650089 /DNA_START=187 /DNA_END=882 /DNA_ORIENTATION=-
MAAQQALILHRARSLKAEIKETLEYSHKVVEVASGHLHDYYKTVPASKLSERIQMTFKTFDRNGNGFMELSELEQALAEMGMRPSADELQKLYKEFDIDGNGDIELDEYEHIVRKSLEMVHACPCRTCAATAAEVKRLQDEEEAVEKKQDFLTTERQRLEKEAEEQRLRAAEKKNSPTKYEVQSTKDSYFSKAPPKPGSATLPATASGRNIAKTGASTKPIPKTSSKAGLK